MGRKKTQREEAKPDIWCFYCDRGFDDENILMQHQKNKHFKCHLCPRKLSTVSGLVIHVMQVHKEQVKSVPNAKEGRDSVELEVFGMQGIPEEFVLERAAKKQKAEMEAQGAAADPNGTASMGTMGYGGYSAAPPGYPPMGMPPLPYGMPPPMGFPPIGYSLPPPQHLAPGPPMYHGGHPPMPGMPYGMPPMPSMPMPPRPPPGGPMPPPMAPPPSAPDGHMNHNNGQPPRPLFPVTAPPAAPPVPGAPYGQPVPPVPHTNSHDAQSGAPKELTLVYNDETESMEEKRAQLPKYRYDG